MTAFLPLACVDFSGIPGCPGCCGSCHDDADAGYSGMVGMPEESDGEVCCDLGNWLTGLAPEVRVMALEQARANRDRRAAS